MNYKLPEYKPEPDSIIEWKSQYQSFFRNYRSRKNVGVSTYQYQCIACDWISPIYNDSEFLNGHELKELILKVHPEHPPKLQSEE